VPCNVAVVINYKRTRHEKQKKKLFLSLFKWLSDMHVEPNLFDWHGEAGINLIGSYSK
jgi:hypothetical protein